MRELLEILDEVRKQIGVLKTPVSNPKKTYKTGSVVVGKRRVNLAGDVRLEVFMEDGGSVMMDPDSYADAVQED